MTVHYDPESLPEAHPNIEETVYFAQYAHALLENKEFKKAKAVVEKGVMAHPEYLTGHLICAHCLKATGNVAEAKKHFKVAFDLDNRCPRAIQGLVDIAAEQQDAKEWKYYSHRLAGLGVTLEEPHWLDSSTPETPDKENTATAEPSSEPMESPETEKTDEPSLEEGTKDLKPEEKEEAKPTPDVTPEAEGEGAGSELPPEGDSKMVTEGDPVEETSQAEAIANREYARGEEKSETDEEEDDASSHELNSDEPAELADPSPSSEPAESSEPTEPVQSSELAESAEPTETAQSSELAEPAESTRQESPENPELKAPHLDWVDDEETSASTGENESPDPASKAEPSSPSDDSEDPSPEETPAEQNLPESGERQGEATIVEGDLPPEVVDSGPSELGPSEVEGSKPVEDPSVESAENLESRSQEAVLSKDSATPTLAEIYFQQGVKQKALDLYRKLLEKQPDNQEIAHRCREIEASIREDLEKEETPREAPKPRRGLRLRRRRR